MVALASAKTAAICIKLCIGLSLIRSSAEAHCITYWNLDCSYTERCTLGSLARTAHACAAFEANLVVVHDLVDELFAAWCSADAADGQEAAHETEGCHPRHDVYDSDNWVKLGTVNRGEHLEVECKKDGFLLSTGRVQGYSSGPCLGLTASRPTAYSSVSTCHYLKEAVRSVFSIPQSDMFLPSRKENQILRRIDVGVKTVA